MRCATRDFAILVHAMTVAILWQVCSCCMLVAVAYDCWNENRFEKICSLQTKAIQQSEIQRLLHKPVLFRAVVSLCLLFVCLSVCLSACLWAVLP